MNRSYLLTLLQAKLEGWKEYLKRPSLPAAMSFRAADVIWSECKQAWCAVELAQVEPITRRETPRAKRLLSRL